MFRIVYSHGEKDCADALKIRTEVFVQEQGFSEAFIAFGDEDFITVYDGDRPVGTARILKLYDSALLIGRIAVTRAFRGKGVGEMMIRELEDFAQKKGGGRVEISAQLQVRRFYEKLGYKAYGSSYFEEHRENIRMKKDLRSE